MTDSLKHNILFDFVESVVIPAFWCCVIYTVIIFNWSIIYFCCNTIPSLHKYRNKKSSSCGSVLDGSQCCNRFTYLLDAFNSITDITLALLIILNASKLSSNEYLWNIFGYISSGVFIIGIILLIIKFKILSIFYPYIMKWRGSINNTCNINESECISIKQWKIIKNKHKKISLFWRHQIMYDLFSASLQDSIQAAIIFYIFADLDHENGTLNEKGNISDKLLLNKQYNSWDPFHWILRIKLFLCLLFMIYKLFRAIGIECNCHSNKIKNEKQIKPKTYIDSDEYDESDVIDDDGGGLQIYITPKDSGTNTEDYNIMKAQHVRIDTGGKWEEMEMSETDNNAIIINNKQQKLMEDEEKEQENKYNAIIEEEEEEEEKVNFIKKEENKKKRKIKKSLKNERLKKKLLSEELNDYGDIDKTKQYLGGDLGDEYEEEWRKNIIKLIEDNKEELQNKTMQPIIIKLAQHKSPLNVVKALNDTNNLINDEEQP